MVAVTIPIAIISLFAGLLRHKAGVFLFGLVLLFIGTGTISMFSGIPWWLIGLAVLGIFLLFRGKK